MGTVVSLHKALPLDALAQLIGVNVDDVFGNFSNLVAPSAIRVHHKSSPDFISDPDRCLVDPQLCIDETAHNLRITQRCLHVVDRHHEELEPKEWHSGRSLHSMQNLAVSRLCLHLLGVASSSSAEGWSKAGS